MKTLLGLGLAMAASGSLATANGGPNGVGNNNGGPDAAPRFAQGSKVTFAPGKGITFDGGDSFSLNIRHRAQAQWRYFSADGAANTNGFLLRRMRQEFAGHVWSKDVTFLVQVEHAETTSVKDAWIGWNVLKGDTPINVRIGQGKFRAGLSSASNSGFMMFVDRAVAANTFSTGRSTGAFAEGTALEDEMLNWHFGIFNTDTAALSTAAAEEGANVGENELNFTAGVRIDPQGNMGHAETFEEGDLTHDGELRSRFGAAIMIGNDQVGGVDVETTQININGAVKTGTGISGQGEIWLRSDDPTGGTESDATGWYLQGAYTLPPEDGQTQWGFAGRVSMVDFDDAPVLLSGASQISGGPAILAGTAGDVFEIQGVASALYHGHHLKTQIGYTFQTVSPTGAADADNHILEVMVTGIF